MINIILRNLVRAAVGGDDHALHVLRLLPNPAHLAVAGPVVVPVHFDGKAQPLPSPRSALRDI